MGLFSIFATPLGYVMRWIYQLVPSYVLTILVFTFVVQLLVFPLSIKNQKSQADRARLAPRLERIQKKYAGDRVKMQEKQQKLYEKEGVSMTGGCLPMIVRMLVLFSIIAVIYKPLTYVERIDGAVMDTCADSIVEQMKDEQGLDDDNKADEKAIKTIVNRYASSSYYRELYIMQEIDTRREAMKADLVAAEYTEAQAEEYLTVMENTRDDFSVFGISLLEQPGKDGIKPNWLWLIAIASGAAALLQSIISMNYSMATMSEEQKRAAGCSNKGMMFGMPIFSLFIAFTVPGGVALYWVFSNLLGIVQTVILNAMYSPAKARAQAEIEYEERRQRKREQREREREAKLAEQAAWQREENEKRLAAQGKGKRKSERLAEEAAKQAEQIDDVPAEPVDASEEKE